MGYEVRAVNGMGMGGRGNGKVDRRRDRCLRSDRSVDTREIFRGDVGRIRWDLNEFHGVRNGGLGLYRIVVNRYIWVGMV